MSSEGVHSLSSVSGSQLNPGELDEHKPVVTQVILVKFSVSLIKAKDIDVR